MDQNLSSFTVDGCVKHIAQKIRRDEALHRKGLPGLPDLIDQSLDSPNEVTVESFVRRFLRVFKDSTDQTYEEVIGNYSNEQQEVIEQFVDHKISAEQAAERYHFQSVGARRMREALARCPATPSVRGQLQSQNALSESPGNVFHPQEPSDGIQNLEFQNWGRTVTNTPALTYVPKTTEDVQNIVNYAKEANKGVRVAGFRHSWSPIFGRDDRSGHKSNGDILISTLGLWNASAIPNWTSMPGDWSQPAAKPLNSIFEVDAKWVAGPTLKNGKKYIRVGTSTTNEQLRRWCIEYGKVTLPMNIIEVEITLGGSNAPICHGAGIRNPTLSDLVRSIEYVDANGQLRMVNMSEPEILKAAAGCFGLIGVVTHLTLEFDPLTCAVMTPRKVPVVEGIPPPPEMKDAEIPAALRPATPRTPQQKKKAQEEFERLANTSHYSEWFWLPYSQEVWVNCWTTQPAVGEIKPYPSDAKTILQVFGSIGVNIIQNLDIFFGTTTFTAYEKTALFSFVAMKNFDAVDQGGKPIIAWVPDAEHFQRGIQNVRVRDMELEIPLHPKPGRSGDRDYTNAQRAWWAAIKKCYEPQNLSICPMRMPLEMRTIAGSEITMAAQRGNTYGTASVEILTLHSAAAAGIWEPFAQSVLDEWMSTCGTDASGKKLNLRPHWAKEWYPYKVDGKPWRQILKEKSYAKEIKEFQMLLTRLGQRDGWTMSDLKQRFSNELLDYLFLDDVISPQKNEEVPSGNSPVSGTAKGSKQSKRGFSKWLSCFN